MAGLYGRLSGWLALPPASVCGRSPTMDLLKPDGSDCGQISLPAAYGYAVPGSDDVMYYVQKTDSGNLVYQLDAENETANPLFSVGNGSVFPEQMNTRCC